MARGYPSNAALKDFRDFQPTKFFNPVQRGMVPAVPANDARVAKPVNIPRMGTLTRLPRAANDVASGDATRGAIEFAMDLGLGRYGALADIADGLQAYRRLAFRWPDWNSYPGNDGKWHYYDGPNEAVTYYPGILDRTLRMDWSSDAYGQAPGGPGYGVIAGQLITPFPGGQPVLSPGDDAIGVWYMYDQFGAERGAQYLNIVHDIFGATYDIKAELANIPIPTVAAAISIMPYSIPEPVIRDNGEPRAQRARAPNRDPFAARWPSAMTEDGFGHKRAPAGRGRKEKKGRLRQALSFIGNILGGWSEFNDALSDAWNALPKEYRSRSFHNGKPIKVGWEKRWNDVYQHWDKIDPQAFVWNFTKDQLTDMVVGKMSRAANNKVRLHPGLPVNKFGFSKGLK